MSSRRMVCHTVSACAEVKQDKDFRLNIKVTFTRAFLVELWEACFRKHCVGK